MALEAWGIFIRDRTVSQLLKSQGYALRVNHKQLSTHLHPDRDRQFQLIKEFRDWADTNGAPLISIDTKKKEKLGPFLNPGKAWSFSPELVYDHDFPSLAEGIAIPYAIYDIRANAGAFYVGSSYDTPEFAVDNVASWWKEIGQYEYPHAQDLCILADSGGSNGCRPRAWKYFLQHKLADVFGLTIQVVHYPSGASKWNPIEHRLFSEVSKNWAGIPLRSMEIVLKALRTTTTKSGLTVVAQKVEKIYEKGIKISPQEMEDLHLEYRSTLPRGRIGRIPRATMWAGHHHGCDAGIRQREPAHHQRRKYACRSENIR